MADIELLPDTDPMGWSLNEDLEFINRPQRTQKSGRQYVWRPPTDVFENEDHIFVRVEISGMKDGDFTVVLDDKNLMIRGVRMEKVERRAYHQMEIRFGEFATQVEIPSPIEAKEIHAEYEDGFLLVSLSKAKPRRIEIG